jgi:hypothetical protein
VKDKIGAEYLNDIFWSGERISHEVWSSLPQEFVLKANHGSGTNLMVRCKDKVDFEEVCSTVKRWKEYDHSIGNGEWQYRWISPNLLCEKYLYSEKMLPPDDYKFWCFNGQPAFFQVDFDRFTNHKRAFYNLAGEQLPFGVHYPMSTNPFNPPDCLLEMIHLSRLLSDSEIFLRVDFYVVNSRPIFGELTLHPGSGGELFTPIFWDKIVFECFKHKGAFDVSFFNNIGRTLR